MRTWAVGLLRTGTLSEKPTELPFDAMLCKYLCIAKSIASEATGLFTAECGQNNEDARGRRLGYVSVIMDGSNTGVEEWLAFLFLCGSDLVVHCASSLLSMFLSHQTVKSCAGAMSVSPPLYACS